MNLFNCFNAEIRERRRRLAHARSIRAMSPRWYSVNRTIYLIKRELER